MYNNYYGYKKIFYGICIEKNTIAKFIMEQISVTYLSYIFDIIINENFITKYREYLIKYVKLMKNFYYIDKNIDNEITKKIKYKLPKNYDIIRLPFIEKLKNKNLRVYKMEYFDKLNPDFIDIIKYNIMRDEFLKQIIKNKQYFRFIINDIINTSNNLDHDIINEIIICITDGEIHVTNDDVWLWGYSYDYKCTVEELKQKISKLYPNKKIYKCSF